MMLYQIKQHYIAGAAGKTERARRSNSENLGNLSFLPNSSMVLELQSVRDEYTSFRLFCNAIH
jgi:hypothetical protein